MNSPTFLSLYMIIKIYLFAVILYLGVDTLKDDVVVYLFKHLNHFPGYYVISCIKGFLS